jgi:hypothetical protein
MGVGILYGLRKAGFLRLHIGTGQFHQVLIVHQLSNLQKLYICFFAEINLKRTRQPEDVRANDVPPWVVRGEPWQGLARERLR